MITGKQFSIVICLVAAIGLLYYISTRYAKEGNGYRGYSGFHHAASSWDRAKYDRTPGYAISNREDSLKGSQFSKRGLSGGK